MRTKARIVSLILAFSLILASVFAIGVFASNEGEKTVTSAEIMSAPNGATGIASLTFADGIWDTAVLVNDLFREYDFKASLMFNKDLGGKSAAEWNNLFADGHLVPESHSLNHRNLENVTLTPEQLAEEIGGSYTYLKSCFPDYDILAYAAPSSSYKHEHLLEVNKSFYAARAGQCVLYIPGNRGQMQSLDPAVGTTPGTWMNMYQVRIQPNVEMYKISNSVDKIIGYLDKCVSDGGWFTSITHAVGDNGDITVPQLREILDAMKEYTDDGRLWVTSLTDATKYVRERQNSTVSAYEKDGVYYVNVEMADTTEDNLPLSADIFNMPLTVKIDVPSNWTKVSYKLGNSTETVRTRGNEAGRYAYINVVPNSGDIAVTNATPENDQTVVGTYTQPANTWAPAEGSGVKFAVWDSEADFLAGVAPTEENIYTTNELSSDNVFLPKDDTTAKSSYVHLFDNCTTWTGGQQPTGKNQTIVINLGGYQLDIPKGVRPGDAYGDGNAKVTFKNGTINHINGDMQCRGKAELRYDNIVYKAQNSHLNYDGNASLVEFKNSRLEISGTACFTAGLPSGRMPCQYRFINTDVYMDENSTGYLFRFNVGIIANQYNNFGVFFDKDSSVIREVDYPLVCINRGYTKDNDVPNYLAVPAEIVFEEGCVLSENIAPVYGKGYSYVVEHYNQSSGQYGPTGKYTKDSRYVVTFDGGFANQDVMVKVVSPGTSDLIVWKNYSFDEGKVVLEKKSTTQWVPNAEYAGITYGLWASEADFLAGNKPTVSSNSTSFTYEIMGVDNSTGAALAHTFIPGYMRLYSDLILNGGKQLVVGNYSFTLDLNGYTLRDTVGIRPGGSSSTHANSYFTVKNGVWIHSTGGGTTSQYQMRQDTKVIFDKVLFIQEGGSFHGCAPDLWKFKDSTFYFLNYAAITLGSPYTNQGYKVSEIVFENTDIFYRTAPTSTLFAITESAYGDCVYDIIFDKDSSLNVNYQTYGLVRLNEAFATTIRNTFKVRVIMEDGFTASRGAYPTFNCTYTPIDPETNASGTAYTLESSTDEGSKFTWIIAEPDTHKNGKNTYYELEGSDLHYIEAKRLIANLEVYYQYIELDSDGNILNTWPLGSAFGEEEKGAFENVNGSTIKFLHDTEVKNPSTYQANNITFDLNGCTLTKTGTSAFQLGYSMSSQWKERVVKFINSNEGKRGVLKFDIMANVIQNRPGSIIVFENIDIWSKGALFTEYGAKSITFTNVNFYSTSASTVIAGGFDVKMVGNYCSGGGVREFVFDNCTFDKVSPIYWAHNNVVDNVKVTFKSGTTFANNGYAPIRIAGDGVDNVEVIIEDGVKIPYLTTTFVAQSDAACATVKGDKITSFVKDGDYYVTAGKPAGMQGSDLQANLTLYTDFQLNFFANRDIIKGITLNGENLEATEFEGDDKYTIKNITPDVAAENLQFYVYVLDGGKEYILPLTYSILKYSEQIMKTSDDRAKALVSAAMEYVKAAYVYTEKAAPEFKGVEINAAENNESAVTNLTSAIKGAQLNLDSGFKLRFNLKSEYSGPLVVNGATYTVNNGKVGELAYVEVNLRAYQLVNPVTVSDGKTTATYGIANYAKSSVVTADANLKALADALYTYATYANDYKAGN